MGKDRDIDAIERFYRVIRKCSQREQRAALRYLNDRLTSDWLKDLRAGESMGEEPMRTRDGKGWAWMFGGALCHWAAPSRAQLIRDGKPGPGAKIVRVRIVRIYPKRRRHVSARRSDAPALLAALPGAAENEHGRTT